MTYAKNLLENNFVPLVQEYIDHAEGEFTVGILSTLQGNVLGSVVLKRVFNSKLSVAFQTRDFLISTGYTQGLIDNFPDIMDSCRNISLLLNSTGPLNIQGRVKNKKFTPFEINPRFSASVYLRALAGFNEVDFYIRHLHDGTDNFNYSLKYGYYMRSFIENYIPKEHVIA